MALDCWPPIKAEVMTKEKERGHLMVPWALQTPLDDIRPCALVLTACFSHSKSLNVTVSQLIVVIFGFKVVTKWYDLIFAYKPNLSKAMEAPELNKIVTMYLFACSFWYVAFLHATHFPLGSGGPPS